MSSIRLFVCCHENKSIAENPLLVPIQVGAALAQEHFSGFLYDDTGDNISERNRSYCELTAQYWAWKNYKADFYGLFHYRRYFVFDPSAKCNDDWGNITFDRITPDVLEQIQLKPDVMREMIQKYDAITVKGRRYPHVDQNGASLTVYHEYGLVPFQHRADLDITLKILNKKYF